MKKIISLILIIITMFTLTSCASLRLSGDFRYDLLTDDMAVIMTLSEEGKTKRELTIPTYIDWYRVTEIGKKDDTNSTNTQSQNTFASDALECVYLESIVYFNDKYQFNLCPNLKKIIYVGKDPLPEIDKQSNGFEAFSGSGIKILCNLLNDGEEIKNNGLYEEANVVYKLNYETTGRDFYDLDLAWKGLIKPQDPTREGYTFTGWYTEPECINEWDFENDEVTKYSEYIEINEEDGETKRYSVIVKTYLYAKWEEIKEA